MIKKHDALKVLNITIVHEEMMIYQAPPYFLVSLIYFNEIEWEK